MAACGAFPRGALIDSKLASTTPEATRLVLTAWLPYLKFSVARHYLTQSFTIIASLGEQEYSVLLRILRQFAATTTY